MRRLQRYVLKELFWPFVISILFFTLMMMITQLFRQTEMLLQAGIGGGMFLRLLFILFVSLLNVTVPMALLLATLIGFGRMTAEKEILAIRASGLNLWTVFWPVIVAAGILSVGLMAVNASVVPRLFSHLMSLRNDIVFEGLYNLKPGTFNRLTDNNLTIYYERRLEEKGVAGHRELTMRDIAIRLEVDSDETPVETLIFAQRGTVSADHDDRSIELNLEHGLIAPINRPSPHENTTLTFRRLSKVLMHEDSIAWERRINQLPISELLSHIATQRPTGEKFRPDGRIQRPWRSYYRLYNELVMRFSLPLACLAFVVVGMPLAVFVRQSAKTISFVITFVLVFFYYMVLTMGQGLGEQGNPLGWFLILSPNLVLWAVGALLMGYTLRK